MKVPLEKEPFSPVVLTSDQEAQLQWLSTAMVDETLAQYQEFVHTHQRVLAKDRWKPVVSRENVTIYRRAGKGNLGGFTPKISLDDPRSEPSKEYWRVPRALGIGTMAGALDDMLYGLLAMTKTETDVRTTYIKDEAPDSRVLATIVKPTKNDPLSALVLRWSLIYQTVHKLGLRPRDIVYLESVGSRVLPSGERVGYAVMQSVDVPGCDELHRLGIIRCKFSTCYLLRDTGNGSVELYMRSILDPGGRVGDRVAVFSLCTSLIAIWRVMLCGQYKKLAWMMHRAIATRPSFAIKASMSMSMEAATNDLFSTTPLQHEGTRTSNHAKSCPICDKSLSGLRATAKCDICLVKTCFRCVDKRKLTHVTTSGELLRVPTRVCKTCIMVAARTSARDVATSEYVPLTSWGNRTDFGVHGYGYGYGSTRGYGVASSSSSGSNSMPSPALSSGGPRFRKDDRTVADTFRSIISYASTLDYDDDSDSYDRDNNKIDSCNNKKNNTRSSERSLALSISTASEKEGDDEDEFARVDPQQLDLWMRMNQIRLVAEETFQLTKQNARAMLTAPASVNQASTGSGAGSISRSTGYHVV